MTGSRQDSAAALVAKLEQKYERPKPGVCRVCGGDVAIAHTGGGLPLKWVCEGAKAKLDAGELDQAEHVEESAWLDYRPVGDARVMRLIALYRDAMAALPPDVKLESAATSTLASAASDCDESQQAMTA